MAYSRPTNFFQRQAQARSSCQKLVVLFTAAVFLIIVALYFAFRLIWVIYLLTESFSFDSTKAHHYFGKLQTFSFWDPALFFFIASVVSLFILIASLVKMNTLQEGGGTIAEMLGGRLIPRTSNDPAERQLLNVVEEMAIASGIHVPQVFVLDKEDSINAFAAGLTLNDAAVAVTRGTLEQLSRDELQGVIAHEFSHILNGDTRLNIQLIGIIYGILIIGIIGGQILEHYRISARSVILFIGGLLLAIIGYAGSFLGRLIQSAVCRQRELLADASAVQFTRNPHGLANALKKIGGYVYSSSIKEVAAKQASHLFFGESHRNELFSDFLATHPPLVQRIRLLDPAFNGKFTQILDSKIIPQAQPKYADQDSIFMAAAPAPPVATPRITTKPADIVNMVGKPDTESFGHSLSLLALIPNQIREVLNTPHGAASVICALLLGNDSREKATQVDALQRAIVLHGNIDEATRLCELIANLPQNIRLPLVELAMPSLRSLTGMEKRNFLMVINALILADNKVTLFEFTIEWMLNKLLSDMEDISSKVSFFSYSAIGLDILIILRALACAGNIGSEEKARLAFAAGVARIPELAGKKPEFFYEENIAFLKVSNALKQLNYASFKIKQSVIDACAHCAFADKTITVSEAELLRVISLAMNCPLPPFVPLK
jgi:Zn-dependent protease with chaperone function